MPDDQMFPGNSHRAKSPQPEKSEIKKVTSGKAIERKPPLGKRIAETFTGDDAQSVGSYILFEVLLPAAKTMISDAVSQGVERLLFGGSSPGVLRSRSGSYTSYSRMSTSGAVRKDEPRTLSRQARANHDFREVVLESRGDAENALDTLQATIDQYDVATVSDLYQMVGISGTFTEEKWGWNNLRGAGVRRVREGYLLDLPRPIPLD